MSDVPVRSVKPAGNCQNDLKRCINCREAHSAAYKGCRTYKNNLSILEQSSKIKSYASIVKKNNQETERLLQQQISYFDLAVILTACLTKVITDTNNFSNPETADKEITVQIMKTINNHFFTDLKLNKIEEGN